MTDSESARWTVERAETPEQRSRAAAILVAHLPAPFAATRRREIEAGTPRDVFLASRGGKAIGAAAALRMPGQLSLVWPPRIAAEADSPAAPLDTATRHKLASDLIAAVVETQQREGVVLAQAMLAADDDAQPFVNAGFSHLAQLIYLQASREAFPERPPERLTFEPLNAEDEERFRNVLTATYEATLDCPQVHQVLSVDATLDSYRGQSGYDPNLWFIARYDGQDVGCLILAAHSQELWELVYMGLVPAARGAGLGADLVAQAQWLAGQAKVAQVALAVDAANAPALNAYRRYRFEPFDELAVYLRPLV